MIKLNNIPTQPGAYEMRMDLSVALPLQQVTNAMAQAYPELLKRMDESAMVGTYYDSRPTPGSPCGQSNTSPSFLWGRSFEDELSQGRRRSTEFAPGCFGYSLNQAGNVQSLYFYLVINPQVDMKHVQISVPSLTLDSNGTVVDMQLGPTSTGMYLSNRDGTALGIASVTLLWFLKVFAAFMAPWLQVVIAALGLIGTAVGIYYGARAIIGKASYMLEPAIKGLRETFGAIGQTLAGASKTLAVLAPALTIALLTWSGYMLYKSSKRKKRRKNPKRRKIAEVKA